MTTASGGGVTCNDIVRIAIDLRNSTWNTQQSAARPSTYEGMPTGPDPTRHRTLLPPTRPPPARFERCHRSPLATSPSLCGSPILQAAPPAEYIDAPRRLTRCSVGSTSPCPYLTQHVCHLRPTTSTRPPPLPSLTAPVPPSRHLSSPPCRCECLRTPGRSASMLCIRSPSAPRAHDTSQPVKSVDLEQPASARSRSASPQPAPLEATSHRVCAYPPSASHPPDTPVGSGGVPAETASPSASAPSSPATSCSTRRWNMTCGTRLVWITTASSSDSAGGAA